MKKRFTTLVSHKIKNTATRSMIVAGAVLMAIAAPLAMGEKAYARDYSAEINALQQEADQLQSQANAKSQEANTLANKLQELAIQRNGLQAQIDVSQAKFDLLKQQIADNEKKISYNKDALGITIADLYVDDTISPLEMLASSKNIGDYVDKQTYRSSVQDTLTQTIEAIKKLKAQLENDKKDVELVLATQTAQRNSLAAVQMQQQALLDQTRGEEAAYQQLVATTQAKVASVTAQQQEYFRSLRGSGGGVDRGTHGSFQYSNLTPSNGAGGCSGGYPSKWCVRQDTVTDEWSLYNRECVSYVAWALQYRYGKRVNNFQSRGMAYEWPDSAHDLSGAERVYDPRPGDVVVLPATSDYFAPVGHVMIVDSVNGDTMHVSQFNFYGTGQYSEMDIKNSGIILMRFLDA